MKKESLITIRPLDSLIAEQVDYYYFQETYAEDFDRTYYYYPNYGNGINVYLNTRVSWDEHERILQGGHPNEACCLATINQLKSKRARMTGVQQKLGLIFPPLGLNYFLEGSLAALKIDTIGYFQSFGPEFIALARKVFETADITQRAKLLDDFLLTHYRPFNAPRAQKAIELIFNTQGATNAGTIAKQLNINRKTLLRLFKKHLTYTPKDFIAIVKFRLALQQHQRRQGKIKLSDIAFDNAYYDQPHFTHQIQSITGLNPTELFRSLQEKNNSGLYWTYEEEE